MPTRHLQVTVRTSHAEADFLRTRAADFGVSVSALLRTLGTQAPSALLYDVMERPGLHRDFGRLDEETTAYCTEAEAKELRLRKFEHSCVSTSFLLRLVAVRATDDEVAAVLASAQVGEEG